MKKAISSVLAVAMVFSTTPVFAQIQSTISSKTVAATGTLAGSSSLDVAIVNAAGNTIPGGLVFDSTTGTIGTAGVQAPQIVKLTFDSNEVGYQAIIVSTDNRRATNNTAVYTGTGTGSGLVGTTNTASAAPLHWTVFDNLAASATNGDPDGAAAYTFKAFTTGADAGKINNTNQFFVVDKQQDKASFPATAFNTKEVLGFATVVAGISGKSATIANAPYNVDDPATTTIVEQRPVTDGNAFMRLAVDYAGQEAQSYKTDTLTLELVTLT